MSAPTRANAFSGSQSGTTDGSGNLTTATPTTKPVSTLDSIMISVYGSRSGTVTVSGGGGTWSQAGFYNDTGDLCLLAVWVKQATSTDIAGTPYVIHTSQASTVIDYQVEIITGGQFDAASASKGTSLPASGTAFTANSSALAPATTSDLFYTIVASEPTTASSAISYACAGYTAGQSVSGSTIGSLYTFYKSKTDGTSESPSVTPTYTGTPASIGLTLVLAFKPSNVTQTINPTDTAAVVSDLALAGYNVYKTITDTAAQISDLYSISTTHSTNPDTGAQVSDTVQVGRVVHPGPTDTGTQVSDTIGIIETKNPQERDVAAQVSDVLWVGVPHGFQKASPFALQTQYGFQDGSIVQEHQ